MNETMYTCAICGKSYADLSERIACETKCLADRKAAEEKKKKMELKRLKSESEKKTIDALANAEKEIYRHVTAYGAITINEDYPYLRYIFSNSKFWL